MKTPRPPRAAPRGELCAPIANLLIEAARAGREDAFAPALAVAHNLKERQDALSLALERACGEVEPELAAFALAQGAALSEACLWRAFEQRAQKRPEIAHQWSIMGGEPERWSRLAQTLLDAGWPINAPLSGSFQDCLPQSQNLAEFTLARGDAAAHAWLTERGGAPRPEALRHGLESSAACFSVCVAPEAWGLRRWLALGGALPARFEPSLLPLHQPAALPASIGLLEALLRGTSFADRAELHLAREKIALIVGAHGALPAPCESDQELIRALFCLATGAQRPETTLSPNFSRAWQGFDPSALARLARDTLTHLAPLVDFPELDALAQKPHARAFASALAAARLAALTEGSGAIEPRRPGRV